VANAGGNTVSVLLNTGGAFAAKADFAAGTNPVAVVAADFNRDGRPDLAAANAGQNTLTVLLNQPPTTPPVLTPADYVTRALQTVQSLNVRPVWTKGLVHSLDKALDALERGNTNKARNQIRVAVLHVQVLKCIGKIPAATANQLLSDLRAALAGL
jgi:hypothetical protein